MKKYEIAILTEKLRWSWSPFDLDGFLPGTHAWLLELIRALRKRGHDLVVYWDQEDDLEWEGIPFRHRRYFDYNSQVILSWQGHEAFSEKKVTCEKFFLWMNDPELPPFADQVFADMNGIITLSHHQKERYLRSLSEAGKEQHGEKINALYPGVNQEEFDWDTKVIRNPNLAIYSSSWDRGLHSLVGCYPTLKRMNPDLELVVTYSPSFMSKITNEWAPVPKEWRKLGIRFEEKDRKGMGRLYREASFMLYPCRGVEMFCLSSWKAQAAGCLVLTTDHMALKETTKRGLASPPHLWLRNSVSVMKSEKWQKELLKTPMEILDWDQAAENFETLIETSHVRT